MPQFDEITALYSPTGFRICKIDNAVGNDLPVIVRIIERIPCDLLSLAGNTPVIIAKGVPIGMTVEIGLCLFMPNGDRVIIFNASRLCAHHVVTQCLLKRGSHKFISRS